MMKRDKQKIAGYMVAQGVTELCRGQPTSVEVSERGFLVRFAGSHVVNKEIFRALKERVNVIAGAGYRVVSMTKTSLKEQMRFFGFKELSRGMGSSEVVMAVQGEGFAGPVDGEGEVGAVHLFSFEQDDELIVRGVGAEDKDALRREVSRVLEGEKRDHEKSLDWYCGNYWTPEGVEARKKCKEKIEALYLEAGCVEVRGKVSEAGEKLERSVWSWGKGESSRGMMSYSLGSQVYFFRPDLTSLLHFIEKISKILRLDIDYFSNGKKVEAPLSAKSGDTLTGVVYDGYRSPLTLVKLKFGKKEVEGTLCESVEKLMVSELENK